MKAGELPTEAKYFWDYITEARLVTLVCDDSRAYCQVGHAIDPRRLNTDEASLAMRAAHRLVRLKCKLSCVAVIRELRTLADA